MYPIEKNNLMDEKLLRFCRFFPVENFIDALRVSWVWHVFKSFFLRLFYFRPVSQASSSQTIFLDIFGRRYVIFTEWSTEPCIVHIYFQRAKLHSGRRCFTNWTRNPDRTGIFSDWEKGRCKSCGKRNSRAERWKQIGRASKLYGFLLPRCSETSHLKIL